MTSNRPLTYLLASTLSAAALSFGCSDEGNPATTTDGGPDGAAAGPDGATTPDGAAAPDGGMSATDGAAADGALNAACNPAGADYPAAEFAANTMAETNLRKQFNDFLKPMRDAEADATMMMKPKAADLKALFDAGMPSLRSLTSSYYAGKIDAWLADFEAAAGNPWMPVATPPATGGKYGAYIFTKEGLDIRQLIEKGFFAAGSYNQALTLMKGTVTPGTVDRLVALYGTSATFPGLDAMPMPADVWTAVYAKRRTKKDADPPGLYLQIKANLVSARAAAAGGAACQTQLQAALQSFRQNWERALAGTVVYYANDAKVKLTKDNATVADISGGLHGIGEGAGFLHGFRTLPAADRIITDAQIDEVLALFGLPATGDVTVYKFATEGAAQAPKLDMIVDKVKTIYGFTTEQIELYKVNQ